MQDRVDELPRTPLMKLSEKGHEQRSEWELGYYTEVEITEKPPLRQPAGLPYKRL